ncbi:MAG: DUF6020 family protein [Acidimicrobiia bacterium]
MKIPKRNTENWSTLLGALSAVPLLVWWAGWFPGIMSSDSIDQWNQALTFDFYSIHPITHTASLWAVSAVWESPGAVALVQVVLTAGLLALVSRRLVQLGVYQWLAIGSVWVIAMLPMTGAMTVTIWKDVPFSLAMLWVATELMLMARDRLTYWSTLAGPVRLGIGLGLMWALRANGILTAVAMFVVLLVAFRTHWQKLLISGAGLLIVGVALPAVLLTALPVTQQTFEPAAVFMPDVAAVFVHDPTALSEEDLELMAQIAPLEVWNNRYSCGDSAPLVFDAEYDYGAIVGSPSDYQGLVIRSALASPLTVIGHRWCAGEYLISPFNRTNTFVHRPRFGIWPNTLGLERSPLSDRAYATTLWAYQAIEKSWIEWLTWRPALFVLAGLITYAGIAFRRRLRPLLWMGAFYVIHLLNVFATSPSHEFRYAYGLYLISLVSLPLWYLVAYPTRAAIDDHQAHEDARQDRPISESEG